MQQTSWNLRKLKRELPNCEAAVFMNFSLIFATSSSVTMVGRPLRSSSWTLVRPVMHYCLTPPSLITSFPYTLQSSRWISIGLWFFHQQKPNHRTHLATRGIFYCSTHFKNSLWTKQSSTNRTLPQLDAYWVKGRSDTKMAALAPPIASPRQNVSG